jgi:hypothetical protein
LYFAANPKRVNSFLNEIAMTAPDVLYDKRGQYVQVGNIVVWGKSVWCGTIGLLPEIDLFFEETDVKQFTKEHGVKYEDLMGIVRVHYSMTAKSIDKNGIISLVKKEMEREWIEEDTNIVRASVRKSRDS